MPRKRLFTVKAKGIKRAFMLKDRFFYPLALALIAGMIWFALSRAQLSDIISADVCKSGYTVEGEDLAFLQAGPGTNYNYFAPQRDNPAYVSLYSHIARDKANPPSAGVFVSIGYQYAQVFHGKTIRMTIRARAGRRNPLDNFDAGYFSLAAGTTDWQRFDLTDNYQDYSFDFSPRKTEATLDIDYFGIWPGVEGKQTTMDVEKFQVTILSGC